MPIEQESELRQHSHLIFEDGDVSVAFVLHGEGKGLGLGVQRAAIRTPRSPLVNSPDGLEARRHLGGQHGRSRTLIRCFPLSQL